MLSSETEKKQSVQKSDDCRKLFAYLLLAGKNLSLYPAGHSIAANAIKLFHAKLVDCIRLYGDFRIEIERGRVLCQGEEVHKGPLEDRTIPFTLFRDGIRWLEFEKDVSLEETREVLSIVNRYAVLSEEAEGDIATDFWEARFLHVGYEAADLLSGVVPDWTDVLFGENVGGDAKTADSGDGASKAQGEAGEGRAADRPETTGPFLIDPAQTVLSPGEQVMLQEMIHREETAGASTHLNMLLDSFLQFDEAEDCRIVLGVLEEEFSASLLRHDFESSLLILEGLRYLQSGDRIDAVRVGPMIEAFFAKVSDADALKPLYDLWSRIDAQQARVLDQIFHRLHPRAARTLAALLLLPQLPPLEKMVEDALVDLARENAGELDVVLDSADVPMAARLVPVLYKMGLDVSGRLLIKLTRHRAAPVRRMALKALSHEERIPPADMIAYLDDEDEAIRRLAMRQMSRARSEAVEDRLAEYLEKRKFRPAEAGHVLDCFKTLGRCGSSRSVPFLRATLMRRRWMAGLEKSAKREGALAALAALNLPEARRVIEEAGRSLFPGLRRLARAAAGKYFSPGGGGREHA